MKKLTVPITAFLIILIYVNSVMATEAPAITIGMNTSASTKINGYLQTPNGGTPGTSSSSRPTLNELGINDTHITALNGDLQWQHLQLYLHYQPMTLSGHAQLKQDLVTHNVTFLANNNVHSNNTLDWKRIGGGWKLSFDDERLGITPQLEFAVMNFSYRINNSTHSTRRSYAKGALRIGLDVHYQSTPWISFLFHGMTSLPTSSAPQFTDASAGIEFNLTPESKTAQPLLFFGVGKQQLDYEDGQTLPNHIRVNTKPFITTGIAIRF